jgi:hypothetical protein
LIKAYLIASGLEALRMYEVHLNQLTEKYLLYLKIRKMFLRKSDVMDIIAKQETYLQRGTEVVCYDAYAIDALGQHGKIKYFEGIIKDFDGDTCLLETPEGLTAWSSQNNVLRKSFVDAIADLCTSSTLRIDIPPFGKAGDTITLNENNFIVVNDELYLDFEEFHKLI